MNISGISTNDYYYNQLATNSTSGAKAGTHRSNPLTKALDSMQNALNSGDTATASSILSNILSRSPGSASSSGDTTSSTDGSSSNPADKITSFLKQVQSALSSGDTATAQSAISSLEDYMASNQPPQPPASSTDSAGTASSSSNPLTNVLDSVASALSSGDTATAQNLVAELVAHSPKSFSAGSDTGDSAGSSTSSASTTGSDPASTITNFFQKLQSALGSGDTSSAQSIVSSLKDYLAANPPGGPEGAGTYSSNGTLFSSSSSAQSSVSILA